VSHSFGLTPRVFYFLAAKDAAKAYSALHVATTLEKTEPHGFLECDWPLGQAFETKPYRYFKPNRPEVTSGYMILGRLGSCGT
jgi:hypothetical protein